jgi:hypothetical protein
MCFLCRPWFSQFCFSFPFVLSSASSLQDFDFDFDLILISFLRPALGLVCLLLLGKRPGGTECVVVVFS